MKRLIYLIVVFSLISCQKEKKPIPIYDYTEDSVLIDSELSDSEEISIPYKEEEGVKLISVSVNGMSLNMIFDTGCSTTLISVAEANYLYQKGLLQDVDILGNTKSVIADGSIVENMVVNLRKVVISDKLSCENVMATVSLNVQAPLLLGNEVLNRAASYEIDNENKVIKFKLR